LVSLFKWHTEARYSTLHLKPCNFLEALAADLAIGVFIKNCPGLPVSSPSNLHPVQK